MNSFHKGIGTRRFITYGWPIMQVGLFIELDRHFNRINPVKGQDHVVRVIYMI